MRWRLFVIVLLLAPVPRLYAQVCCKEPESEPRVGLRKIVWARPTALSADDLQKLEKTLRQVARQWGAAGRQDTLGDGLCVFVGQTYQNRGYFFAEPRCEAVLISAQASGAEQNWFIVDLFINPAEGNAYRLRGLRWKNATVFSREDLNHAFPLVPGEIFDRSKIIRGLEAVRNLYRSRGYIDFTPVPNTRRNPSDHTMELEIDVGEGKAYRWGELEAEGMRDRDKQVLLAGWEAVRGRPSSNNLKDLRPFFDRFFRPVGHHRSLSECASLHTDESKGAVDVQLLLRSNPTLVRNLNNTLAYSRPRDR
jgi:hypothetical protein